MLRYAVEVGDTMREVTLAKNLYSEEVIRKALYWLSPTTRWTLDCNRQSWIVRIEDGDEATEPELHRLLNDFVLREKISGSTDHLRLAAIKAALRKLS